MAFKQPSLLIVLVFSIGTIHGRTLDMTEDKSQNLQQECSISDSLVKEIKSHEGTCKKIFDAAKTGYWKGKTYEQLGLFIDKFGGRLSGSKNLENSIDYMVKYWKKQNVTVYTEDVKVPYWERGNEEATMLKPVDKNITIVGLGHSIPTPKEGITADVLVVKTFDELNQKSDKAKGKIVVFNQDYFNGSSVQGDYGATVKYRALGAVEAAKVGAVACLVRSIGPYSIYSPHGGYVLYNENVTKIPTASITLEDADLLSRFQDLGKKITITMKMDDSNKKLNVSRNTFGEIKGRENPDDIVIISGHIDSWDNGQGVMDDAGGSWITVHAAALLNRLNLQPRRTLRSVLWTAEEMGFWGVKGYIKDHKKELKKHKIVMESDIGTWEPTGLDFSGSNQTACVIKEVAKLLKPMKASRFRQLSTGEVGSDIIFIRLEDNVPTVSLNTKNSEYFWYHHTQADTMSLEDSNELDHCLAVWACTAYVISEINFDFPRE